MQNARNPLAVGALAHDVRRIGWLVAVIGAAATWLPAIAPTTAHAQGATSQQSADSTGRVTGTVTDASQAPLAGAQVTVVGTRIGAVTEADGRFRLAGVPAGAQQLRVQRIGQQARTVAVQVSPDAEATVSVALDAAATTLGGVVVSASRRTEKITDAPATITSIGTQQLDATVGNTFANALKEVKGLDFIQVGMTSVAINARGFNSSFNNRMLMVEDGRISVLPENGLPVGQFTPTPKVDLAGMEVLVGPGSALYGPDASNGVLYLRAKDPKEFPGATLEVTGGNRGYADVQGRYAAVRGNFGFKVAGEYQQADDWDNYLTYNAAGGIGVPGAPNTVREDNLLDPVSWDARTMRGTASGVWYAGRNRLELSGGMSRTDGVGQTNVGRNQLRDWDYNVVQARWQTPHWYANAYRAQSKSGTSFALNRYAGAQLTPANASLDPDSLRKLADWPSDGRMYAAEIQGNYSIPMLLNTAVVFGAQYRNDVVSSDRQWLTDRYSNDDVSNKQTGVYGQMTTPVSRYVDVVLAGRWDKPDQYPEQWSPKAGVVVKPREGHAIRATFNRAFKSPTILQTNFFIPDWTPVVSIYGNTGGFTVTNAAGTTLATYDPVKPEENKTWEFGYKGIFKDRLFLDATYFRSNYENFLSPLAIISNPFQAAALGGPTYALPTVNPSNAIPVNAQGRIVNPANVTPLVLIYYNLGNARVSGTDLGATFLATDRIELRGTLSTVRLDSVEVPAGREEATTLNSPTTKWTIGATARDFRGFTVGGTFRTVNAYYFRSGVNTGVIPTFNTVDLSVSYKVPVGQATTLSLGVSNLFTCSARNVQYQVPVAGVPPNSQIRTENRGCGFGRKHVEMINMPEIGTMAFLGVRLHR